ncbi:MAG: SRPBCC family protein [Actinomycetota bacterium]
MTTTIERSIDIDTSADRVWHVAAHEFDRVGEWTSQLNFSKANTDVPVPVDATVGGRVCSAPGFGEVKETITNFSEQGRTLTYEVEGLPGFVKQVNNTWTVTPLGEGRARINMRVVLNTNAFPGRLLVPILSRKLGTSIGIYQQEMKLWVEEGRISPAKEKLKAKLAAKAAA